LFDKLQYKVDAVNTSSNLISDVRDSGQENPYSARLIEKQSTQAQNMLEGIDKA
jgi:hypothetical protein